MTIRPKAMSTDSTSHEEFRHLFSIAALSACVGILAGGAWHILGNFTAEADLSDNLVALQPLLLGSIASSLVYTRLLMHWVKPNRCDAAIPADTDELSIRRVSEFMTADVKVVASSLPLCRLFERYEGSESLDTHHSYPVVDEEGALVGMIARSDLPPLSARADLGWLVVADIMSSKPIISCHPQESLRSAAVRMAQAGVGRLPVVLPETPERLVGVLSRGDVFQAFGFRSSSSFSPEPTATGRVKPAKEGSQPPAVAVGSVPNMG